MTQRLLYIYSETCDVCKAYENLVYDACTANNISYDPIDVDENIEYCRDTVKIPGVPAVILFDENNTELARVIGVYDERNLNNWLKSWQPIDLPTHLDPDC